MTAPITPVADPQALQRRIAAILRNGGSPQLVQEYLQQHRFANPDTPAVTAQGEPIVGTPGPDQTPSNMGSDALRAIETGVHGLTGQFSDELTGLINSGALAHPFSGPSAEEAANYIKYRDESRARLKQYAKDHPVLAPVMEFAAGAIPAIASAGATAAPSAAASIAPIARPGVLNLIEQGMKAGGTLGAVSGLGAAEGTPAEQALQTERSALLGTAIGAGLPMIGGAAGALARATHLDTFARPVTDLLSGLRTRAANLFSRAAATTTPAEERVSNLTLRAADRQNTRLGDVADNARPDMILNPGTTADPNATPVAGAFLNSVHKAELAHAIPGSPLEKPAEDALLRLRQAKKIAGAQYDALTHPGGKPIPLDGKEVSTLLKSPTPAFAKVVRDAKALVPDDRKVFIPGAPAHMGTVGEAMDNGVPTGDFQPPNVGNDPPNIAATKLAKFRAQLFPIPKGPDVEQPTVELLHNIRRVIDAKQPPGSPKYNAVLGQKRNEISDFLKSKTPNAADFAAADKEYNRIADALGASENATGARWNPNKAPGKPGYEFQGIAQDPGPGWLEARALGSFASGSPHVGATNLMAAAVRKLAQAERTKTLQDAAEQMLQQGPKGQAFLEKMAQDQTHRFPSLLERARASAGTVGMGSGLLSRNLFQPQQP